MTTPASRHPWLWNTQDIRKALNSYRDGEGYGGVALGDPEAKARVESDPAVGGFPAIAALAGDAAARIDEARKSEEGRRRLAEGLAEPVLTIAHYALAQMARSLGGEGL